MLTQTSEYKSFSGRQLAFRHDSASTGTEMNFSVFLPPQEGPRPVLWFLSGLTCTDQNVVTKGGYQRVAAKLGLIVICPDTSPRGAGIQGEETDWDLGTGASFYLDATSDKWRSHYRMESYITSELPDLILPEIPADPERQGISGHSMGGHGALTLALRHPDRYRSVSAFSPICAPSQVPWGQKAFSEYLQSEDEWAEHDATALIMAGKTCAPILVDQGEADQFLHEQLCPERLDAACSEKDQSLKLRMHEGYDHSYYFISTFMENHLRFHEQFLCG